MKDLLMTIEAKSIALYNLKKQSAPKELLSIIKDEVDEEDEDDYFYNDDDVEYNSKKYKLQEIDEEIDFLIGSLL